MTKKTLTTTYTITETQTHYQVHREESTSMTYHERMACLESDMLALARIAIASSIKAEFPDTVGLEAARKLLLEAVESVLESALEAYYHNRKDGPSL